ncbi:MULTISPECIES: DNA primase large subunit PriL [Halorussus]|uniref:DNA primase large subunit PriL n=1 Tax=Halorussus TaxID=1070314 RepID=UPI00209E4E89|nr:DNA primase large subunit PriL [Halorussus vallis]USZ73810.1 DNA primase large subunit PriL [Halorussus vallis]
MKPLHADYPFLEAAREAVREAEIDLSAVIAGERVDGTRHPAVERGVERVRRALLDGTVEPPEDARHPGVQTELLSYPVARVLVSMLDTPGAVEKYASAEAETAYERFTDDFEVSDDGDLRSADSGTVTLEYLLSEVDLADAVESHQDGYRMAVTEYLPLASGFTGDEWRLAARQLSDGQVALSEDELHALLREAVRRQVADGLPTQVPEEIQAELADELGELEESFSEVDVSRNIDVLAPELFPPCVSALVERAREGETLPPHSAFSLTAFLASVGADADDIAELTGESQGATSLEYRVARVADDSGAQYLPPTCETMQAYGDCVNKDDRCETISHPLAYYEEALADAESVHDWREAES